MVGISLISFLILFAIAAVVAAVFHFVLRYRFLGGIDAFLGKIVAGWLGGWVGSPVLGHWLFKVDDVYVIPAIVGAVVAVFLSTLLWKALAKACGGRFAA
jgi:uncharacterized membrane protein YeaQ/YmgE (transglycosylase-associated protein family)